MHMPFSTPISRNNMIAPRTRRLRFSLLFGCVLYVDLTLRTRAWWCFLRFCLSHCCCADSPTILRERMAIQQPYWMNSNYATGGSQSQRGVCPGLHCLCRPVSMSLSEMQPPDTPETVRKVV